MTSIIESINNQNSIRNTAMTFDTSRMFGRNKYKVAELREIALSRNIKTRINNKYKTHAMLCAELSGNDLNSIDIERLGVASKNKYTITELRGFARNLGVCYKNGNKYRTSAEITADLKALYPIELEGILIWQELHKSSNKWYGLTKLQDIAQCIGIINWQQKTKVDLYQEINKLYIEWVKINNIPQEKFSGVCVNPNIFGEEWTNINKKDVVMDEMGYCFTTTELAHYFNENRTDHPWTTKNIAKVQVKGTDQNMYDYLRTLSPNINELVYQSYKDRLFKSIDVNSLDYHAGVIYLINKIDSYIKSGKLYIEPQWIYNTLEGKEVNWWRKFTGLNILTINPKLMNLKNNSIKNRIELLEILNQIILEIPYDYVFKFRVILFLIFRPDRDYSISQINYFVIMGFPDNAFTF